MRKAIEWLKANYGWRAKREVWLILIVAVPFVVTFAYEAGIA